MGDYDSNTIDGEGHYWLRFFSLAFIFVLIFLAVIFYYDYKKDLAYIAKGYQMTPIIGPVNYQWQKVNHE